MSKEESQQKMRLNGLKKARENVDRLIADKKLAQATKEEIDRRIAKIETEMEVDATR